MDKIRYWLLGRGYSPSTALLCLAAALLALDHRWSEMTLGAASLAFGAVILRRFNA